MVTRECDGSGIHEVDGAQFPCGGCVACRHRAIMRTLQILTTRIDDLADEQRKTLDLIASIQATIGTIGEQAGPLIEGIAKSPVFKMFGG